MKKEEVVVESDFDRFWSVYPPRKGDKGKTPARILFEKAVKSGIHPMDIIRAATQYAITEKENLNTPFIMQAQRWLRNKRWSDYEFVPIDRRFTSTAAPGAVFVLEGTPQWREWQKIKKTPCVNFGWWFPSEWPPEDSSV